MIDSTLLHSRVANRAADFIRELFGDSATPAGADQWRVGNRGSLALSIRENALVFYSHEEGTGGDAVTLWQRERGGTDGEALRAVAAWAGMAPETGPSAPAPFATANRRREQNATVPGPKLPEDATPGQPADWHALAALRSLSAESVGAATFLGTLSFGTVCGARCWILTDARQLIAEARRMDGQPFPATDRLGERKAHTLKGSVKSWPVGLVTKAFAPRADAPFLIVEGGPDYLAALHYAMRNQPDELPWHPIAFLGAGTANAIHEEAMPLLAGRRARIYPHHEASGAGAKAAGKWAAQLAATGAIVDAFSFAGLRTVDGSPVKDLNDCTRLHPSDAGELEGLLP